MQEKENDRMGNKKKAGLKLAKQIYGKDNPMFKKWEKRYGD